MRAPFFGAFHALTIDDAGGGAGVSFRLLAAFHVQCVMNAIQHAVALPPNEVIMDCAARRKILRKVAPLAASAQDSMTPFMTARMSVRRLPPPLFAGGMNGSTSVHRHPSGRSGISGDRDCILLGSLSSTSVVPPRIRPPSLDQLIHMIQQVSRRTLRLPERRRVADVGDARLAERTQ